jgi:multidrug resistance efflux pump
MKKRTLKIIYIAIFMTILSACSPKAAEESPVMEAPNLIVAEGRLLPIKSLDHSFNATGQVAQVLVEDGDEVRRGDALARLFDSPEAEAVLASAQKEALATQQALDDYKAAADVNLAQAQIEAILAKKRRTTALNNYYASKSTESTARLDESTGEMELAQERFERIAANNGLEPDELNSLEAQVQSSKANVESAQAAIDALTLEAAMSGTVADVRLTTGQQVTSGEVVMAVADFSEWIIETDNLTEIEVVDIAVGQEVEVTLDALPDVTLKGEVANINARFEEKRGDVTYTVTVTLKETDPLMRWGLTAAVLFAQ